MNPEFTKAANAIAEHFKQAEAKRGEAFADTFKDALNDNAVVPTSVGIPVALLRALANAQEPVAIQASTARPGFDPYSGR